MSFRKPSHTGARSRPSSVQLANLTSQTNSGFTHVTSFFGKFLSGSSGDVSTREGASFS